MSKQSCDWNRILPLCIVQAAVAHGFSYRLASVAYFCHLAAQCMCLYAIFVTLAIIFVALQCLLHVRYFCRAKQHVVATCPLLALLLGMTSSLKLVLLCFGAKVPLDILLLWNKKTKAFLRLNFPLFPTNQNNMTLLVWYTRCWWWMWEW